MLLSNITQIITAIGVIVGIILGVVGRKGIHKAVNSTSQKQNARVDTLTKSLTDAGVDVPPRNGDT